MWWSMIFLLTNRRGRFIFLFIFPIWVSLVCLYIFLFMYIFLLKIKDRNLEAQEEQRAQSASGHRGPRPQAQLSSRACRWGAGTGVPAKACKPHPPCYLPVTQHRSVTATWSQGRADKGTGACACAHKHAPVPRKDMVTYTHTHPFQGRWLFFSSAPYISHDLPTGL